MESAKLFFRENPFPATPSPDRFLAVGSSEAARARLMDSIDRREGPALIVGPPGTGKTLLCQLLALAYKNEYDVAFLSETRICTRKALLQHILHHLGLPYSDHSEGELRLSLIDRAATGGPDSRRGVMIIVDEAQALPGRLLEELRMMSGIVRNGSPRVQLVLAGGPSLDERLSQPRMEALSQRIGARCYLHPLGQSETGEYINNAFRRVGADPANCLEASAVQSVYYASNGIIRLINQTMSRAIGIAESIGRTRITGELVERAWADIQQLPSPLCEDRTVQANSYEFDQNESFSPTRHRTSVVEFGSLDEEDFSDRTPKYDPMAETTDYPETREVSGPQDVKIGDDEVDEEIDEVLEEDVYANADLSGFFGDGFEEEQILTFNTPAVSNVEAEPAINDAPELAIPASETHFIRAEVQQDLERALHDEIVAINCDAMIDSIDSLHLIASLECDEDIYSPPTAVPASASHEDLWSRDEPVDETTYDDSTCEELIGEDLSIEELVIKTPLFNRDDSDFDESMILEDGPFRLHDSPADDEDGSYSDITVRDDSDMLIIEDDLDVNPLPQSLSARGPRTSELTADDADFQAIFAKLREG